MLTLQFHVLTYLGARHWAVSRGGFAVAGYLMVIMMIGRHMVARDTARLIWADQYKTALHRLDWCVHYGWPRRFMRRRPAFDITQDMPATGLDTLDLMLANRTDPADLRARLYIAAARNDIASYSRIGTQIAALIPAATHDTPAKHAPAFTQSQARAALAATAQFMRTVNMPWYIVSGTFLGAVRAGDFLAHDYDIDIGVHAEDFDHATFLAGLRATPDFCLVRIDDYVDLRGPDLTRIQKPALYKIMHRTGVEIDIFLHYLADGQRWHGSARHRWWNVDFDTIPYTIAGLSVLGPANADTYLSENYGDWRTPKTDFDCSTGTPNVSFNRNLVSIAQFLTQAQAGSLTAQTVLTTEGYLQGGQFICSWAMRG